MGKDVEPCGPKAAHLHAAVRAVLEPDGDGKAGDKLTVQLAFRCTRPNSTLREPIIHAVRSKTLYGVGAETCFGWDPIAPNGGLNFFVPEHRRVLVGTPGTGIR